MDDEQQISEFLEEVLGEISGAVIRTSYPSDLHFVCGCANFDPCGHNDILRETAREYFRTRILTPNSDFRNNNMGQGKVQVRSEVAGVLELAHIKAQEATGSLDARFRIWKPNLPPKKRLSEATWEETTFQEITGNIGSLKKNLEWPLRRALEDVQKALQAEGSIVLPAVQPRAAKSSSKTARSALPQPEAAPSSKRAKVEPQSLDDVVRQFVDKYNQPEYLDALDRLDKDRGTRNIEEWAKEVYIILRDDTDHARARGLNMDRRKCLNLLYELVNAWEEHGFSEDFEQAIDCVFKTRRLVRILAVCLPMDRAQSLYKMRNGTDPQHGMPWYSKHHLETDNSYARDYPNEQIEWIQYIGGYSGNPTMNRRLFRLLFSDRLGLRSNEDFRKWSRPAMVPDRDDDKP